MNRPVQVPVFNGSGQLIGWRKLSGQGPQEFAVGAARVLGVVACVLTLIAMSVLQ